MADHTTFESQKQAGLSYKTENIKATPISSKQYLWDQLHKHIRTDPLESILHQLDKQPDASNDNMSIVNGPHTNNPTYAHSTLNTDMDNSLEKSEENNEHNISEKANQ